jgi:hypothetical protein
LFTLPPPPLIIISLGTIIKESKFMSAYFFGGCANFKKHENIQISDVVLKYKLDLPPKYGVFTNDSNFSIPTGGTWGNSSIFIYTRLTVYTLNEIYQTFF